MQSNYVGPEFVQLVQVAKTPSLVLSSCTMNRWKAASWHLCMSIIVIGSIAGAVFLLWYPDGLYRIAGLDHLFLVMLGIDLTAGPMLTCVVYEARKPGLKRDLAIIGVLQLTFLGYGLRTTWESRPIFLVGLPDQFNLVYANEVSDKNLLGAKNAAWRSRSWSGPLLVGTQVPSDPKVRAQAMSEFLADGTSVEVAPKYYEPYDNVAPRLLQASHAASAASSGDLDAIGLSRSKLRQVDIVSSRGAGLLLIDASNGMPLRVASIGIDPVAP